MGGVGGQHAKEDVTCLSYNISANIPGTALTDNYFGSGSDSMLIWMDDVMCDGDEESLEYCRSIRWGEIYHCTHIAGVRCSN